MTPQVKWAVSSEMGCVHAVAISYMYMYAPVQYLGRDTLHTVIHVYISFTLFYLSYMYMYAVVQRFGHYSIHIHMYAGDICYTYH